MTFLRSKMRPAVMAIALMGAGAFGVSGTAHAQYGDNTTGGGSAAGQAGSTGQRPAPAAGTSQEVDRGLQGTNARDGSTGERGIAGEGILKEGADTGFVDQEKRVERNQDPRSPSPDDHVDIQRTPKKIDDPAELQGGPIGPN